MKKFTQEQWLDRAKVVHGSKYDYSEVKYINASTDVTIKCNICGNVFDQNPNKHLRGQGCPKCRYSKARQTVRARYGVDNPMQSEAVKQKLQRSCQAKYGTDNPMQSEAVKQRQKRTVRDKYGTDTYSQTEECKAKVKQTSKAKYGTEAYSQTEECKEKVRQTSRAKYGTDNPMQSDEVKLKLKETVRDRYGTDSYMQTDDFSDKSKATLVEKYGVDHYSKTDEYKQKIQKTCLEKYDSTSYFGSERFDNTREDAIQKAKETCLEKYGSEYYQGSADYDRHKDEILEKANATKRERGTFNSSSSEDMLYGLLCDEFGSENVLRQYSSDEYPFACDFYVKSLDLYIELNASWTHGGHWFGYCDGDAEILGCWRVKNTDYYDNAIRVWSERDLRKRQAALNNKLNYIVFWDKKLRDAALWLAMGCPVAKFDPDKLYSWLPERVLKPEYVELTGKSARNISRVAKFYQFDVFYKRELGLFGSKVFKNGVLLDVYLYANRLQYLGKTPERLSDPAILNGFTISGILKGYTEFDTTLMDQVIQKYNIRSVYDPCAGWGERMLYCYLHDIDYFGVDVNHELVSGYYRMIAHYRMTKQSIVFGDASDVRAMPIAKNAVLTCPPYGSIEKYSSDGAENLSESEFLEWWDKLVKQCLDFEYFCFQINQRYKRSMQVILEQNGFVLVDELTYKNNKSSHFTRKQGENLKREFETMLVLKKC